MEKQTTNNYKCGMVSIVGRPNVGKSTLLNTIVGEKVSIVSKIPQTTRNQFRGIYSDERGQIIFIDTPGLHKGSDNLDRYMNNASTSAIPDADCVIYLVDSQRRVGEEELRIAKRLYDFKGHVIFAINKMDKKKGRVQEYIEMLEDVYGQKITEMENVTLITISAIQEKNIDGLLGIIFECLPMGPALYPTDVITDTPKKLAVADLIREKLFRYMKKEIPHSIGIGIDEMRPVKGKTLLIRSTIFIEEESQKEIVIGKNGSILKVVGKEARLDLEALLETKVFLELFVKVQPKWRVNTSVLYELGYSDPE